MGSTLKSILPVALIPFMVVMSLACTRKVDLKVNGRPSEYLEARIVKSGDLWKLSVDLPVGQWKAELRSDAIAVQVEPDGSHSIAWWRITPERVHQDKPFTLELIGADGKGIGFLMEVRPKYPGQGFVDGMLTVVSWLTRVNVRV